MNNGKAVAYQPHKQRLERAFKLQMPGGSRAGIERAVEDGSSKIERGTSFGGAPPPTPEELDRQLRTTKLQSFGKELQEIANASLSTTEASRYRNVYVLILKWEDEDPQLPVSLEISKLKDAFVDVYHFNTEVWDIPDEDCHDSVNQKILDFKRLGSDSKDDLKILYYGGHGRLTRNRSLAWSRYTVLSYFSIENTNKAQLEECGKIEMPNRKMERHSKCSRRSPERCSSPAGLLPFGHIKHGRRSRNYGASSLLRLPLYCKWSWSILFHACSGD